MKHIKLYEQEETSRYKLNKLFYHVHDMDFGTKNHYMDFIESLNLTKEQYHKLASIIEDYGFRRYNDGLADGQEIWSQ
jgi:hypothetical protein